MLSDNSVDLIYYYLHNMKMNDIKVELMVWFFRRFMSGVESNSYYKKRVVICGEYDAIEKSALFNLLQYYY